MTITDENTEETKLIEKKLSNPPIKKRTKMDDYENGNYPIYLIENMKKKMNLQTQKAEIEEQIIVLK